MLVPELIRVFARSCSSSRMDPITASPMGGEASPLLLPATSIPSARTQAAGAPATEAIPTTATTPAATAMKRGPVREVNMSAMRIVTQ
jgi:hypothetical protein